MWCQMPSQRAGEESRDHARCSRRRLYRRAPDRARCPPTCSAVWHTSSGRNWASETWCSCAVSDRRSSPPSRNPRRGTQGRSLRRRSDSVPSAAVSDYITRQSASGSALCSFEHQTRLTLASTAPASKWVAQLLPGNADVLIVAAESCDLDEMEQWLQAGRCQTCDSAPMHGRRAADNGAADRELNSMPTQSMQLPRSTQSLSQSLSPTRRKFSVVR